MIDLCFVSRTLQWRPLIPWLYSGKQEGVTISLDCSRATFLTEDRLVVSLKGGELYVVTLVADSLRAVRSFHFDKAASSVLTCCVSAPLYGEGVWVWLANYLLIRLTVICGDIVLLMIGVSGCITTFKTSKFLKKPWIWNGPWKSIEFVPGIRNSLEFYSTR